MSPWLLTWLANYKRASRSGARLVLLKFNWQNGFKVRRLVNYKRLNTGMVPTCDWMIKIVKVNKLYFISLLVNIVDRVSQGGTMKYQCERKHRCVKQEMVTYVAKGRQPFLFSKVVQRYSGDENVICWLISFSQFRRTIRDWSHSCISPLTGIAPSQTFINFFFYYFLIIFKQFF